MHGFDFWYSYGTGPSDGNHMHQHYWNTDGKKIQINRWFPEHETDIAMEFINENKNEPFALFLSFNPPHLPTACTPEKYKKLYDGIKVNQDAWAPAPRGVGDPLFMNPDTLSEELLQGYYGAVTGLDENIGKLLEYLKAKGIYDNTWIVISSDHGDMLGEHGLQSKHIWYEGSAGIPLIIGGGNVTPQRTQELVCSPDQTATVLGLLNIPVPSFMQGKDFSPLIRGEALKGQKSIILAAFPESGEAIQEFRRHRENFMDYGWRSIVTREYKLAVIRGMKYGDRPRYYLYDLKMIKTRI